MAERRSPRATPTVPTVPTVPIIGIDLGTSNTLAATLTDGQVHIVPLKQYTAPHEVEARPLLPSCLYTPLPQEAFEGAPTWVVGEHARRRASEVPDRVVTSAKSWLCHAGVDREAAILPWTSERDEDTQDERATLSPVKASELVLRQVRTTLQQVYSSDELRDVVLTVPASFDQVARKLTVQAAEQAGFAVTLLEEPQAAFYDWLHRAPPEELEALAQASRPQVVLVVDVGGGTTDLTLLRVSAAPPESRGAKLEHISLAEQLAIERVAVGRHLLLGGDNIDLALAHLVERKLQRGKRLAASEFAQLIASCKGAKERLLATAAPDTVPIRLARRGAALLGNVLTADLTREEVQKLVLDGFVPEVTWQAPARPVASGLLAFGLPYERDAAITRHIADFLRKHRQPEGNDARQGEDVLPVVDAVLFNGGLFKSELLVQRVTALLEQWAQAPVRVLSGAEPEYAVARGAVWYGSSLRGQGVRISGGSPHGYYVGVHTASGAERAVCVVPKGAHEDEVFTVAELPLELTLDQPVRFELLSSNVLRHAPGELIDPNGAQAEGLQRLPPVSTRLTKRAGTESSDTGARLPVHLQGALTAVGTLDLACIDATDPTQRFALEFELRSNEPLRRSNSEVAPPAVAPAASRRVAVETRPFAEASEVLLRVFGKGRKDVKAREVKDVWRELERCLGPRREWDLSLNRHLFDVLIPLVQGRRRSADHERIFFSLAGYLLRPGFGHALDEGRVQAFEPLFEQGLVHATERLSWEQFFIAWRRVASGVSEQTQSRMRELCDPFIAPHELKLKKPKSFKAIELPTLWDLVSWLERVSPERRASLGQWVVERTWTSRNPKYWEWLGRIGAREPVYASAHHVVRPRHVEAWLDHLLSESWAEAPTATLAAFRLARCTGDRARDVNDALRERVAARLANTDAPAEWALAVRQHVPSAHNSDRDVYGEDLPVGLRILD